MRTLDVGLLVHRVSIQQLVDGVDASGAPHETWAPLCEAQMGRMTEGQAQKGGEAFKADQWSASVVTRWTMRYAAWMDPDEIDVPKRRRLVYRGRSYDIVQAEVFDPKVAIMLRTLAHSAVTT